jgi:hypothetical protein
MSPVVSSALLGALFDVLIEAGSSKFCAEFSGLSLTCT